MTKDAHSSAAWAAAWQASWDRLQESYMPDRELRIAALLDVVEAVAAPDCLVLDLACATGTVTLRLLERFEQANVVALDVDPALLAIASATFATDDRVRVVRADLRDSGWVDTVGDTSVYAVVTATALHWLPEAAVRRLYRELAGMVRPGGALAHAEEMPLEGLPCLGPRLAEMAAQRRSSASAIRRPDWDAWWERGAQDPALSAAVAERAEVFGGTYPEEFSPPADWHIATLIEAGFGEAGVVWRNGSAAVVAAVR